MLNIVHYTKTYPGGKTAVDDLTLHVPAGEICGFIGHNGAGKTTTLRAVAGVMSFTEGVITIGGHDIRMRIEIGKKKIYLSHYPYLCFEGGYKDDVWQLFGHVHTRSSNTGIDAGRLQYLYPTQLDVGVDNSNFTPLSFEQVRAKILKQLQASK